MKHKGNENNEIEKAKSWFVETSGFSADDSLSARKSVQFRCELCRVLYQIHVFWASFFVGDINCRALPLNKITNMRRAKSFITQNGFALRIYFAQKFGCTLRIMNLSAARHSNRLIAIFFQSTGGVPSHLTKSRQRTIGGSCDKYCSGCRSE